MPDDYRRRTVDRNGWQVMIRWVVGVVGLTLITGAGLWIRGVADTTTLNSKEVGNVKTEQAGTKEQVKGLKESFEDFRAEQRKMNTEIKGGQEKTNDQLGRILTEIKGRSR